jgi:hypothetical protein
VPAERDSRQHVLPLEEKAWWDGRSRAKAHEGARGREQSAEADVLGPEPRERCIERFNKTYRKKVLDAYLFESLDEMGEITYKWMKGHNDWHSNEAKGGLLSAVYWEMITREVSPSPGYL